MIPRSGRSPRERNGYPLQYSCLENSMDRGVLGINPQRINMTEQLTLTIPIYKVSLMVQHWRICLPMQEMQVLSLGQKDPLEEEMARNSSILVWEISWTEESGGLQSMGWGGMSQAWLSMCTHDLIIANETWGRCVGHFWGRQCSAPSLHCVCALPGGLGD